ncbi:hypothetical protein JTE90_010290 [Oedothorax gibbosus]|uniref:Uncharacterized protein n=1 Tax=Oedothorax gibbosus TaxID=931172 RepID=A0AAV6V4M1_9ARAC|nr:hypothetical protein JTE90_010290 [Oedothorax gibbosus]
MVRKVSETVTGRRPTVETVISEMWLSPEPGQKDGPAHVRADAQLLQKKLSSSKASMHTHLRRVTGISQRSSAGQKDDCHLLRVIKTTPDERWIKAEKGPQCGENLGNEFFSTSSSTAKCQQRT